MDRQQVRRYLGRRVRVRLDNPDRVCEGTLLSFHANGVRVQLDAEPRPRIVLAHQLRGRRLMAEREPDHVERSVWSAGHLVHVRRHDGYTELSCAGEVATVKFSRYYGALRFELRRGGKRGAKLHEGTTDWHKAGAEFMLACWWREHLGLEPVPFEKPTKKGRRR